MKKVVFGSAVFLGGLVSVALLLVGAMSQDWVNNNEISAMWNLSRYGLMPAFGIFIGISAAGLIIAVIGMFEKKK